MINWIEHKPRWSSELNFGSNVYMHTLAKGKYIGQLIDDVETRRILDEHELERVMLCLYTGMGTGKTQFALNILSEVAKERHLKVLYISPRKTLREQQEDDYSEEHLYNREHIQTHVTFTCYQPLLDTLKSKKGLEHLKSDYDIIVFDEFHQPFSDSAFIEEVEPLMKWILDTRQFVVVLSATYDIPMERIKQAQAKKYVMRQEVDFSDPTIQFKLGTEKAIVDYLSQNKDKSIFICQYKLFSGGKPTDITKYCLDNKDELQLTVKVGDSFFNDSKWKKYDDYDSDSVKTIQELNTSAENKLMPSRTYLTSSVCSTGVEFFGYVDENGEVVDKIDIIVVNFLDMNELEQAIARVRKLHDVIVLIVCHTRPTLNGALQQIRNIYSDLVMEFFEEDFTQGTRTKLDSWIELKDNRTKLPNGLYVEIGTGRILLNYTEISNVYYKRQELLEVQEIAKTCKHKNSSEPHRKLIRTRFISECNCKFEQFEVIYSTDDIVDDELQVDEYLTELFTDELANRQYNNKGEFLGVLISTDKKQLEQFAKNIGSVTDRKKPSAKEKTVNKTLEQYGLDNKWRVERRQVRDGDKRPSGLMLVEVKEEPTEE